MMMPRANNTMIPHQGIEILLSDKISYYNLDNIQKAIDNAQDRIRVNANFDITMEVLFLDIKGRIGK